MRALKQTAAEPTPPPQSSSIDEEGDEDDNTSKKSGGDASLKVVEALEKKEQVVAHLSKYLVLQSNKNVFPPSKLSDAMAIYKQASMKERADTGLREE
mmetsp:Transcript_31601/g.48322  ORF Transcript_31601/g.48322 Transcript_31601/m.48322 type:complete len:98 (+) Transcript_31601:208-501(+)|eukprot:CAMPEP_0170499042 /NCGR_PEP_ID=MMETSP0208-20121228/29863_1 /TAXON_ID=197538 /ORGANISM="Strombidium inclinatum, Strain S3" /LENGTH=97 /DNA_ID=CAMNT_0010776423 /DNA_START=170 /DNA_END=463 /DNA_ORIENTATION=-